MSPSPWEWRLILGDGGGLDPEVGSRNMAVDAALLASVRRGSAPVLRFYRWSPACLSFGRNQPARGRYDRLLAAGRGIGFVRRPTGGQAVLHDDELTYAVVAPAAVVGRPREAYRKINEALVAGLRSVGVAADVAGSGPPAGSDDGWAAAADAHWDRACFRQPAAGELMVRGRKLVGSAQRTEGRVILQHGSLLVGGSQAVAEELLFVSPSDSGMVVGVGSDAGWTTLAAELGTRPDAGRLAIALATGFESTLGISLAPSTLTASEAASVDRQQAQFSSDAWTWRR